jgi:tetratricopeptide (TPR) repeat protein
MDNSTPDMNELLVQYLDGELQGAEKQSLEQQLAADAALQQQFDSLLLTRESVRYYGLKEKVAGIHQQMMKEMNEAPVKKIGGTKKILRYAMSVAASLLLLIGGYFAYQFFNLSAEKVYGANYQPYELSASRDGNAAETAAEKAYREGNYKEVIRISAAKEDVSVKAAFLSGAAAMQLKDYPKAISSFTTILEANKNAPVKILNDETEYYLALSYIHNRDYDYALELLNKIKEDPAHTYNTKVTRKLIRQVRLLKWR